MGRAASPLGKPQQITDPPHVRIPNCHIAMSNCPDEETTEPLLADHRNYYEVEK